MHKETVEMNNNHVYKWTVASSETVPLKVDDGRVETNRTETESVGRVSAEVKQKVSNKETFGSEKVFVTILNRTKHSNSVVKSKLGIETMVKKALMALKFKNLREGLKNNWSFLYNCTLLWSNENCIEYLKFYHGEATTIQLSLKIRSDFMPLIQVHGKHVSPEHDFWSGLPEKYTTPADIVKLLTKLHGFTVCMGNPDKEYQSLIKSHVESRQPPQAYVEGDFGAVKDGVSYTSSIRSIACELLTKYKRCRKCLLYRNTLTRAKTQETKDIQNAPSDLLTYKKLHSQMNCHVPEKTGNGKNRSGLLIKGDPGTSINNLNEEAMQGKVIERDNQLNMVHMQIREQFDKVVKDHLNMVQDCDVSKRNELDAKFNTALKLPQNLDNSFASQIGVCHEDEKPIQSNETAEMFDDCHPVAAPENPHPDLECGLPSLVLHCESHQSTDMHDCKECEKAFPRLQDLKKYARTHYARKTFKCRSCRKIFPSLSILVAHRKVHAAEKRVKCERKCDKCGKAFSNVVQLQSHTIREHWEDNQFKCNKCDKVFSQYSALIMHKRTHIVEKPFKCCICNRAFTTNDALTAHMKTHTGKRPYKCTHCSKAYFSSKTLKSHMRIHTGENPCKCKLCGKAFSFFSTLHTHMMVHSGEKPYQCEYCDGSFHTASTLAKHRKTHTGEKSYKCDICPKAFLTLGNLKIHRVIHTGEKPYKCKLCNMAFNTSTSLTRHQKVHSGEKPHQCEQCGKRFTQSTQLRGHLMVHKGEKPKRYGKSKPK